MDNSGKKDLNIFTNRGFGANTGNPFNAGEIIMPQENEEYKQVKRLNGYDSAILNKATFDDANEQDLSMDYRIKEKENILKDLDNKIKIADDYGNQNESLGLKAKRQRIMQDLSTLRRNQAIGKKGYIFESGSNKKISVIRKVRNFVSRYILAKVSKKINSIITLSDSLDQLSLISQNVDQLVDLNIPYGEKIQNYEKLTEYLNKANKIHSSISKSIRR